MAAWALHPSARRAPQNSQMNQNPVCQNNVVNGREVVEQTGVITALSISVPWQKYPGHSITPVGSIFGEETFASSHAKSASGTFIVGPGPTSVTVSMSVHWDNFRGTGPRDLTTTRTLSLGPCQPIPLVTFEALCHGELKVGLANGDSDHRAGGTVVL